MWQFHLVENYDGGSALIARIHHCYADGIALVRVMLSMTDAAPRRSAGDAVRAADAQGRADADDPLAQLLQPVAGVHEARRSKIGATLIEKGAGSVAGPGEGGRARRPGTALDRARSRSSR